MKACSALRNRPAAPSYSEAAWSSAACASVKVCVAVVGGRPAALLVLADGMGAKYASACSHIRPLRAPSRTRIPQPCLETIAARRDARRRGSAGGLGVRPDDDAIPLKTTDGQNELA